ncbi:hypothetical protein JOF29_006044 [Kribbella aluminosa]|uniref:Secreted protein n=1 Tax=Kribbella aluminosa TaxID=416017 RepID=A0ABS4UTG9_9ACTN|nr:hypothetical protein [Kribbella aluminosa]MBP2354934.1 hypothetical protein [Kribbella aluminosa]
MRRVMSSKLAVPLVILVLLVIVVLALVIGWRGTPEVAGGESGRSSTGEVTGTSTPGPAPLSAWVRPATTDPVRYAAAFGTTIWTYDTAAHSYAQWQNVVSSFADSLDAPDSAVVARSMLPYASQWEALKAHGARAAVRNVTAAATPELQALARDPRAPKGWHAVLVRGTQDNVLDGAKTTTDRHVTVGVICRPQCTFWSATNELPQ